MAIKDPHEPFYDALRLSENERQTLVAALNSQRGYVRGPDLREDNRLDYTLKGLIVHMRHPGGSCINYLVRPRNISSSGIGFLHGNFCYTGTPCRLSLRSVEGKRNELVGRVVRCRHVQGLVHEVGVKFDEPIELDRYVNSFVRSTDGFAPATRLPRLKGRVLYVEDCLDDQELLRFHLAPMGLEVVPQTNPHMVCDQLDSEPFDLIITGRWLAGMDGCELIENIHQAGHKTPILCLTSDHTDQTLARAKQAGAASVVTKPYCLDQLAGLLSKHLLPAADPNADPLISEFWPNIRMRPLILNYLDRLDEQLEELGELLRDDEQLEELARQSARVRGSAGGYGYPQISEAAERLYEIALSKPVDADQLKERFTELSRLGNAACQLRQPKAQRSEPEHKTRAEEEPATDASESE